MELLILFVVVLGVMGYFLWRDRKYEDSGSHPLDGSTKPAEVPYKLEPPADTPVLTTVVDGIGHESVSVKPEKAKKPAKTKNAGAAQTKTKKATPKPATPTKGQAKPKKSTKK